MKRFVVPLLALCALALPMTAHAGHWVTKEIFWQLTSQGSPYSGTAIYTRDTTFNDIIGSTSADTTGIFSLQSANVFNRGTYPVSPTSDTLTVAYLLFCPDTSAAGTSTLASVTVKIDGGLRGFRGNGSGVANWTQIDSLVVAQTLVRAPYMVPIRAFGLDPNVAGNNQLVYQKGYASLAYPDLRARITACTGQMPMVRAFVRYWSDSDVPGTQ